MIKITRVTKAQIKAFNEKEWRGVDLEHYGKPVEWKEKRFILKATDNGKIVGSAEAKHESGVLYIGTIIVADSIRGTGVGKQIMDKLEEYGKKLGAHKAHLITGEGWKAENFYKKMGYRKVAELPNHHFHRDFVIYEKDLA